MKARIVSSVVLAAAVALGATGCNLISPQATTYKYDASDGVSGDTGAVAVRNAILIAGKDEGVFNLVFTGVNSTDKTVKLNVQLEVDGAKFDQTAEIKPGVNNFGGKDEEKIVFEDVEALVGSIVITYFQAGDDPGVELDVPVLDGTLDEYKPFVLDRGFTTKNSSNTTTDKATSAPSNPTATAEPTAEPAQ